METKRRSVIKALSWRFFATFITASVAYALTREWLFALEIGLIDTVAKLAIYYVHERLWLRVSYGKVEPTDYQI